MSSGYKGYLEEGHEVHVSLDTAILLKQAGFNWGCSRNSIFYPEDGFEDCSEGYYAPRLDLAQKWLREVKNIYLYAYPDFVRGSDINPVWQIKYKYKIEYWSGYYDTYEEALEAGIKKALELILEKGE